ncbi:adhesion G protein-coupled receptor L3-like isoform X2 [Ptychodera flava]|uniref:adhesion G protein-coupled receptor L3-like isoform X2 n=1 Tax=Ptychodera flava TaxID=63121 RepID=UPI00396A0807
MKMTKYIEVWCFLLLFYAMVTARGGREPAVDVTGFPVSCNDYYMRTVATGTSPADGIYTINYSGNELKVYCDMSRHGGGWTLVLTSTSDSSFTSLPNLYEVNTASPSLTNVYSILSRADGIKKGATGDKIMYRIEAFELGRYGGIWEMPINYTFVSTAPDQPSTLVQKFDEWTPSVNSVQDIVPWIYVGAEQYLTTNDDIANDNFWGTLACVMCYAYAGYPANMDPTPWMNPEMPVPGIIWYWMKEYRDIPESQCSEDGARFDHWKTVSNDKETFLSMALVRPEDIELPWETAWKALTITTTYTSEDCLPMGIDDLVLVYRVLRAVSKADLTTASDVLEPLTKNFLKTASRLLNVNNRQEWQRGRKMMGPTVVLDTIDEFAMKVADSMMPNTSVNAETYNIRLSIISITLLEASEYGLRFPELDDMDDADRQDNGGWVSASADSIQELLEYYNEKTQIAMISLLYTNITELLKYDVSGGDVFSDPDNVIFGENVISTSWRINEAQVNIPIVYQLPLQMHESQILDNEEERLSVCTFLKFSNVSEPGVGFTEWSSYGCQVSRSSSVSIQCNCNHTTNFAVLMRVVPFEVPDTHSQILRYITYTGCSISIVAMIGTLTLYSYLKSLLPAERISIHKNLIVAIIISHVISMATESAAQHEISCKAFAIILHYACTAMFLWMLAEGIHLYRQIVAVYGSERSWMNYYYAMAWGFPFVIVAITAGIRLEDYGSNSHCWLSVENGVIWAFVGPAITIMAVNLLVLILVVRVVVSASQNSGHKQNDNVKAGVKSSLLLLPLLGITWCFGLFATGEETLVFLYIFAVLNSLQGLFIFLFHVVYNSEVRSALRRRKEKFEAERGQFVHSTLATNGSRYPRSFTTKSTRVTRMSSEQTLQLEDVINEVKMLDTEEVDQPKKVATVSQTATDTLPRQSLTVYPSEPTVGMKRRPPETTTSRPAKDQLTLNRPIDDMW